MAKYTDISVRTRKISKLAEKIISAIILFILSVFGDDSALEINHLTEQDILDSKE